MKINEGTGEITITGRNAAVGTSLEEIFSYDVPMDWNTILASAAAMDVSSSNANDTADGSGARKVRIYGVDGNFAYITEDVTLNGQTKVTAVKTFLRVFGAEVIESGSGRVNAGDIHIVKTGTGGSYTNGVPGTLTSAVVKILMGWGSSGNGLFTTPAGQIWKLKKLILSSRGASCTILIQVQEFINGNTLTTPQSYEVGAGATEQVTPEILFNEKQDIRIRAISVGGSIVSIVAIFERIDP